MERRYYAFKTLVIAVALGFALFGYMFGTAGVSRTYTRTHYSAASTIQITAAQMGSAVGHALLRVVKFFH